jgi:hypothetical protein
MIKMSHIIIGGAVYDYLKKKGIILDKAGFLAGCALPDINQHYGILHPHFPAASMGFVKRETYPDIENGAVNYECCLKPGIIIHYWADFFCHAHSAGYRQLILNHVKNARGLHKYLKNNLKLILEGIEYLEGECDGPNGINESVVRLHAEYRKKKRSLETDVKYILLACAHSALSIVQCSRRCGAADYELPFPLPAGVY